MDPNDCRRAHLIQLVPGCRDTTTTPWLPNAPRHAVGRASASSASRSTARGMASRSSHRTTRAGCVSSIGVSIRRHWSPTWIATTSSKSSCECQSPQQQQPSFFNRALSWPHVGVEAPEDGASRDALTSTKKTRSPAMILRRKSSTRASRASSMRMTKT